jgi:predicted RNA methylase
MYLALTDADGVDEGRPRPLGNTRVTGKEQFYTPPNIARDVVTALLAEVPDAIGRTWLEPAGGTGAFIDAAEAVGVERVVSYDIEPHHPQVALGDFLAQRLELTGAIAVSNPPFGRNNALSIPFFNRCADHCDYIAFIVPRSWRKWSVVNRLDRRFHVVSDTDLAINYVNVKGEDAYAKNNLRTCVQIWRRESRQRSLVKVEDRGVVQKCSPAEADVALTIFGYGCGTVNTKFPRRKVTTQMYLRLVHPRALEALDAVDFGRFFNNVAYTEALSFPEINYLLNEFLFGDPGVIGVGDDPASGSLF